MLRDRLDNPTFINPTILEIWDLGPLQWTYHPDEEFKWSGYSEEGSAYIVDGDPVYRVVVARRSGLDVPLSRDYTHRIMVLLEAIVGDLSDGDSITLWVEISDATDFDVDFSEPIVEHQESAIHTYGGLRFQRFVQINPSGQNWTHGLGVAFPTQ